mmetsp:Transcript_50239/g.106743  ORF Transcript_50239/g.106743 Transcript_50239/m.106743 type:complete len:212 (+) Transcript_50239:158-793(+)|eukprot:CAMPEP_0194769646 /NCGR_PEP_ID=MMETSP0323_2-20130528/43794_1 /TAXON_ID=2866 ORGANISM="Crypthecodinium cohnii, Strain Seligo" /NCGR_SAMPLE_ID=MMETSP0323_2 /ASSEMBLY_ACC=CAM_ASM_000346 /LENGTH=211 /DNA_ID=CAMNT_0039702745 /DNA_START=66 /DNA_END=701 /DNA_ORIENTATION=-
MTFAAMRRPGASIFLALGVSFLPAGAVAVSPEILSAATAKVVRREIIVAPASSSSSSSSSLVEAADGEIPDYYYTDLMCTNGKTPVTIGDDDWVCSSNTSLCNAREDWEGSKCCSKVVALDNVCRPNNPAVQFDIKFGYAATGGLKLKNQCKASVSWKVLYEFNETTELHGKRPCVEGADKGLKYSFWGHAWCWLWKGNENALEACIEPLP